jgi:hypothetical protein
MISCADILCDAQESTHLTSEMRCEVRVSIRNDVARVAKVGEDMLHIKLGHSFCIDSLLTGEEDGYL